MGVLRLDILARSCHVCLRPTWCVAEARLGCGLGVGAWKISVEDVARPSGYGKLRVGFGDRRRGDKAPNNVTVKPNLSLQATTKRVVRCLTSL